MQCPHCGTANPAQARFCLHCGQALSAGIVCSTCHTLLPSYANYCYHCGTLVIQPGKTAVTIAAPAALSAAPIPATAPVISAAPEPEPAPAPSPQTITRELPPAQPLGIMLPSLKLYLPQTLYEPLERRPNERHLLEAREHLIALLDTTKTYLPRPVVEAPQPGGEPAGDMYRGVFLFGDVSGFTPLSEQLKSLGQAGAERITAIINSLFTELVQVLFQHGGTLLKFGGDALLGLFPAESDAEMAAGTLHATQAALAMQEVMLQEQFAAIEAAGEVRALRIKCGISAGPYFAAHIGTPQMMAYVTTGHTVNRAEQAEGHANPGDVVITEEVHALLAGQAEVGPPEKEPEPGFYRVLHAPPASDSIARPTLIEPPEGPLDAQITYLVQRLDRLAPYLNSELLRRIVNNPGNVRISPDHRPVTVLFANYKGISDLIQDMGDTHPEIITQQLNSYFVHMAEVVERYEGTLARMDQYAVGDRLVVFFGAPRAHEDDPVRAVYTALDMQKAVRENFSALQTPSGIYRFEQRIGINTGALFAGNAGAPNLRQEYTLMGDDINMAARLMSYSEWGQILVSKKTQERVAALFEMEDKGEIQVKGKQIRIHTYAVMGHSGEIGRTRGLKANASPLIGRDAELQALQMQLQSLLQAQEGEPPLRGSGKIVTIIGDSGLGKSRFVREIKTWLKEQPGSEGLLHIEGQALSFSEYTSYWLAAQVIRGALQLPPDASENDVLFELWERGEALMGRENAREAVPFLAHLLGIELEGEWAE